MPFALAQFEHHFEESALRRGLRLFQKSGLELVGKSGSVDLHFSGSDVELFLQKKGGQLISYSCSCKQKNFCEHLAAALFILQKETFILLARKKNKLTSNLKGLKLIKQLPNEDVIAFVLNPKIKDQGVLPVTKIIAESSEEEQFAIFCWLIRTLTSKFYSSKGLNQQAIEDLNKCLNSFLCLPKNYKVIRGLGFCIHLSLLSELQNLLQLRYTGMQESIEAYRQGCYNYLDNCYKKGLSPIQKQLWYSVLKLSLRNNTVARSGAYSFLLPRFLNWSQSKSSFTELARLIEKRKGSAPQMNIFNPVVVAKYQLSLRDTKVNKSALANIPEPELMNAIYAEAELAFCGRHIKKGFKLLEKGLELCKKEHKSYFGEFSHYAIGKAVEHNMPMVEQKFLYERVVRNIFLNENDFDRWLNLLPANHKEESLEGLIGVLRQPKFYSFEKISFILNKVNRTAELIAEIKRHGNSFRLLHQIALTKTSSVNKDFLLIYSAQFVKLLEATKIYSHQLTLFKTATEYIDTLPEESAQIVLEYIMTYSGSESQISKHIRKNYVRLSA